MFVGICSFSFCLYFGFLKGFLFFDVLKFVLWNLNRFFTFIMNFVISLWSSQTWSCFGFGMKDKPFFSSCIWVVVNIVSLASITTSLHSIGSDKGSTENSFDSIQDSANDSQRLLILSLEFCLCLFLL